MSASPQTENGYTKIANELLDAVLKFGFSKRQLAVFFGIVRKTYGFNKLEDDMTVTQLAQVSGLARQNASTALSELEAIGAVSKRCGQYGYVLKINKNYREWGASKQDASKRCANRIKTMREPHQNDAPGRIKTMHTKDNSKRQLQKTTPKDKGAVRPVGLPECISDDLWRDFVQHRKAIKKPMTDKAADMVATKLQRFEANGHDPRASLEDSIASGWTGVFEPKGNGKPALAQSKSHGGFGDREYTSHIPDWAKQYAGSES